MMAGWLKRVDPERFKVHRNIGETKPWFDREPLSEGAFGIKKEEEEKEHNSEKIESLFNEFLPLLLEALFGGLCFRPLPPMLGDGQSVDLFQLYLNVRKRGGCEKVSGNEQWDSVAKECGFDAIFGSALKLVYEKYLGALCTYLEKILEVKDPKSGMEPSGLGRLDGLPMDLESDLDEFLSGISDKKRKNAEPAEVEFNTELGFECDGKLPRFDEHEDLVKLNGNAEILEKKRYVQDGDEVGNESGVTEKGNTDDKDGVLVNDNGHVKRTDASDMVLGYSDEKEDVYSRKRGRECSYSMLNWIKRLAMDPCDPEIGSIPDSSKWKYYATDLPWKQVLLVRQALLLKRQDESSDQQAILQVHRLLSLFCGY